MQNNTVDAILFLEKMYNDYQDRRDIVLSLKDLKSKTMLDQEGWCYTLIVTDLENENSSVFNECFMPQAEIDKLITLKQL